jgi:hypothetical protein
MDTNNSSENQTLVKNDNNRFLDIKATQTSFIKDLVKRIRKNTAYCNIDFHCPDKSSENNVFGSLQINQMSEDKSFFLKVKLDANNFHYFRCKIPQLRITLDMRNLYSKLKIIDDNYPIVMYISDDDRNIFHIEGRCKYNVKIDIQMFIFDRVDEGTRIPEEIPQNKITMPIDAFYKICKNISIDCPYVEITIINNEIKFKGKHDYITMTNEDPNCVIDKNKPVQTTKNRYMIKDLLNISKCKKSGLMTEIYIKDDSTLVLGTNVGYLGKMYIFISSICEQY